MMPLAARPTRRCSRCFRDHGLAQLDAPSRRALTLVAIEDRSYAEAGEIAGVSVPALKSRNHRPRPRLSDILELAA